MRAELHLARRYLIGLRRRTHVATVTLISLVGLGLGVFALVITLAMLEGFQSSIRGELVNRATHARVSPAKGRYLEDPEGLASVLQESFAMSGDLELVQVVRGTCLVAAFADAVPASVIGRDDAHHVVVDHILAARLSSGPSDTIKVISPRQRLTPMGPLPVRMQVELAEIRAPEPGSESGAVILPLERAQNLLWGRPVVQAIEIRDPENPWRLGPALRRFVAGREGQELRVEGLVELHRPLLLALAMERVMIFVAVGLMLVVAALNLLCNVAMIAAEKRIDLAVLGGLGMTPVALRRLFLLLGLGIGLLGSVTGALLGSGLAVGLDLTRALPLPRGVFVVSAVPFTVQPGTVAAVMAVAMSLAALASWLPSRLVARREPAVGLRYE